MKKQFCILSLMIPLLFASCANYSAQGLPSVETVMSSSAEEKNDVIVAVKFLSPSESKQYFGVSDVAKKYQPALIAVENHSSESIYFKKNQMSHYSVNPDQVATRCKFSTGGRIAGYGIAGLFLWPLLIPAVVDGIGSYNANTEMEGDFAFKEIKDSKILPGSKHYGVAFFEPMYSGESLNVNLVKENSDTPIRYTFSR